MARAERNNGRTTPGYDTLEEGEIYSPPGSQAGIPLAGHGSLRYTGEHESKWPAYFREYLSYEQGYVVVENITRFGVFCQLNGSDHWIGGGYMDARRKRLQELAAKKERPVVYATSPATVVNTNVPVVEVVHMCPPLQTLLDVQVAVMEVLYQYPSLQPVVDIQSAIVEEIWHAPPSIVVATDTASVEVLHQCPPLQPILDIHVSVVEVFHQCPPLQPPLDIQAPVVEMLLQRPLLQSLADIQTAILDDIKACPAPRCRFRLMTAVTEEVSQLAVIDDPLEQMAVIEEVFCCVPESLLDMSLQYLNKDCIDDSDLMKAGGVVRRIVLHTSTDRKVTSTMSSCATGWFRRHTTLNGTLDDQYLQDHVMHERRLFDPGGGLSQRGQTQLTSLTTKSVIEA
jgi:hypothetical protein